MRGSRQRGEEEFIDDARTRDADATLLCDSRMGRHHHAALHPRRPHRYERRSRSGCAPAGSQGDAAADLGAGGDASGREDDLTRCSLCRV